jgi:hypothetical protein
MDDNSNQMNETGGVIITPPPDKRFKPLRHDAALAIAGLALGYMFARWVLPWWQGFGVGLFTGIYLLATTLYFKAAQIRLRGEAIFWLAATALTGLSCAVWQGEEMLGVRGMFLFLCAVYYTLCAGGGLIGGKTGGYVFFDGLSAVFIVPFKNFGNRYVALASLRREKRRHPKALPIVFGTLIALFLISIVAPLLLQADSGGFQAAADAVLRVLARIDVDSILDFCIYIIPAIPVSLYLCGLITGVGHGRGTDTIKRESLENASASARVVPGTTVYIVLGAMCALYVAFVAGQLPYFFSAFRGVRPTGFLTYAEYARRGFFELITIAAVNLSLIIGCNLLCRRTSARVLKAFNIALSVVTLLLIVTAFSKMALYVRVYGMTMKRLLPCVLMAFLAIVFVGVIVYQSRKFAITRCAVFLAASLIVALCVINPDALVVRYNTSRYLSGTLSGYDIDLLYRSGAAGVKSAREVLIASSDPILKHDLQNYINYHQDYIGYQTDPPRDWNAYTIEQLLL